MLEFKAGSSAALGVKLELYGLGVRVNAPDVCQIVAGHIECALAARAAGSTYLLPVSGASLVARVSFMRASDATVYTLQSK